MHAYSNINISRSLCNAGYMYMYYNVFLVLVKIPPCFDFYIATYSYSSRPLLCALVLTHVSFSVETIYCTVLFAPQSGTDT